MRYLDITNQYLLETQRVPKERIPLRYWPSQASAVVEGKIWGKCHRDSYWGVKGTPYTNKTDLDTIRKGLMGKASEINEIELARNNPAFSEVVPNYKFKVNITKDILISGEFDNIIKKGSEYRIIEYKTGGGRWYRDEVLGSVYSTGMPKAKYILQVMLYLDLVKKYPPLKNMNINKAEIQCLDREKCKTVSHEIYLDDGYPMINGELFPKLNIEDIYDRYKKLHYSVMHDDIPYGEFRCYIPLFEAKSMLKSKQIPKWQYNRWEKMGYGCDIECEYCSYLHRCQVQDGHRREFKEV